MANRQNTKVSPDVAVEDPFVNVKYICSMTSLVRESLRRGCDVAQLPNGDVIITEIKVVNTQYCWDRGKQRLVKLSQY